MPATFEDAFAVVQSLAKDFKANEKHFLSPSYQESEARKDFIDKFLIALGWDVNHDWQKSPFEQEVKVERGVSMQGSQHRADYAFFIAPNFRDVRFFCEAKKPAGDIATADNYFQTTRYGWNAQTPIALLTDFEQFQILDCRYKPDIDAALNRCIRKFHYSEYADKEKFAFIYHLFSRDAVANGSLEKFAAELPKQRGKAVQRGLFKGAYQGIDDAFLEELDGYRDTLARAFKNNNPKLDGETLTEITQRTIDRLVFMRFLEDKLIHPDNLISGFGSKGTAWQDFVATSRRLDGIYNGIVFKQHAILDAPSFKIDDDDFAAICEKLAHINSPYDFNSIPIHILGSIYERFLGKVIVTTDKRARLEEKPEVRKAGGVYYTPEYIVRYIVENTVGKLIDGRTPRHIADLKFADIACGSGSFLLGVYDLLLRYHLKWFNANPDAAKKAGCVLREDGAWHLSLKQRREILLNNLFGVDIDSQAVEVAQLSLYLKLLQEETPATARGYQLEFHETLLPALNKNIVCGNSLVGPDIEDGELFACDEIRKLNPMDYAQRFPQVFRRKTSDGKLRDAAPGDLSHEVIGGMPLHGSFSYKKSKQPKTTPPPMLPEPEFEGGFDAIVGNPPYVFGRDWKALAIPDLCKKYFRQHYTASPYQLDMFSLFMERVVSLVRLKGAVGLIVPDVWLTNTYSSVTRNFIFKQSDDLALTKPPSDVFGAIVVDTVVLCLQKAAKPSLEFQTAVINPQKLTFGAKYPVADFLDGGRPVPLGAGNLLSPIIKKLLAVGKNLGSVAKITRGVHPYRPDGFGKSAFGSGFQTKRDVEERPYHSKNHKPGWREFIYGKDLSRLAPPVASEFVKYGDWLAEPRTPDFFEGKRVYSRKILAERLVVTVETENTVADQQVYISKSDIFDANFLAGVLGSRLIAYFIRSYFDECTTAFPQIKVSQIRELPLPNLDLKNADDKARHDKMVLLVDQMLAAKKQLASAKSDKDKDFYGNKCESLDRQIDALVYQLYGLTDDEIKIVEGAGK